ncbi:hypothetical protein HPC49_33435 [Pyxidicoccus fallax]|uniref:SbsA Ig-like domain-containing protein n=1 Tax=Pyxidicoccus fallax TaxID=394095 RepID=A0A848LQR1_9BACT|nr:Ig-like domain-containing protein [Pyxidicoccus fallax]NMO19893.1 hypothetical protein [Pyxidicoccus fallax]NPC83112.1 hypothetical protein [Pyxidicoccus fallax]
MGRRISWRWLTALAVSGWLVTACGGSGNGTPDGPSPDDAGTNTERDSGTGGPGDAGQDAGLPDAGAEDAGSTDAGPTDVTPPDAPELLGTSPVSPANDNLPRILVRTEPGARVRLYTVAGCSGAIAGEASANTEGQASIPVTVADDSWTSFHGLAIDAAGNTSPCSSQGVTYRELSTPPSVSNLRLSPSETANDNAPLLLGSTAAGATVRLYFAATCSGTPAATQVADATGTFSLRMQVPDDSVTATHVSASDAAGNASACTVGPTYREDSTPPAAPALATTPVSPANHTTPVLQVTTEPGAEVRFFAGTSCAGAEFATRTADNQGLVSLSLSVSDNSSSAYVARARDAVGNVSACSPALTYVEDSTAPSELSAVVTDGLSGADVEYQNRATRVAARWSGFSDAVGIHHYELAVTSTASCPGDASSIQGVGNAPSADVAVGPLSEQRYYSCVRAVDGAGNISGWRRSNGFIVDVTPPRVVSTNPPADWPAVSPWDDIEVTFNESTLDTSTVTPASLRVLVDGREVSTGPVSCATSTCTFSLTQRPAFGAQVDFTLSGVRDVAGNVMAASHTWSYRIREPFWTSARSLSGTRARLPTLTMNAAGDATVMYVDNGLRARRHRLGESWEAAQPVGEGVFGGFGPTPVLTSLSDGRPLAVVTSGHVDDGHLRVYGILGTDSGSGVQGWSVPQRLGGNTGQQTVDPRVVATHDGRALALWTENDSTTGASLWVQPFSSGSDWEAPSVVRVIPPPTWTASWNGYDLGVDSEGNGVVVWSEAGTVFHSSRYVPGIGWSTPTRVESQVGQWPRLALSADGTGVAVWARRSSENGTEVVRLHANTFSVGMGFDTREVPLHTTGHADFNSIRVAMDANGNAFVIWRQDNFALYSARYVKGSGWQPPVLLEELLRGGDPNLGVFPSGKAMVLYGRNGGAYAPVCTRQYVPGTGWSSATCFDSNVSDSPQDFQVATSPFGNAAATWIRASSDGSVTYLSATTYE